MAAAALTGLWPLPAELVERVYSDGLYGEMQPRVTALTNLVPWALLDVLVAGAVALGVAGLARWRGASHGSARRRWAALAASVLVSVAALYLCFLGAWGLNYRRMPLDRRLEFDPARVTTERVVALAEQATRALNDRYEEAHRLPWPSIETLPERFGPQLADTARALRLSWAPRAGRPKASLLAFYLRWAAIAGVTNPLGLEVIPNPDTLPFERHAVMAHEWAHLAGFAHEAEANAVGWLMCMGGDAQARYSGWLGVWPELIAAAPRAERKRLRDQLAPGPARDFQAIVDRTAAGAIRPVTRVAWGGYDLFLRSQHVREGVASYGGVVRLLAGSALAARAAGRPRPMSSVPSPGTGSR